jgi:hypothetical protein
MHKFLKICAFAIALLFLVPAAMAGEDCEVEDVCVATMGATTPVKAPVDNMVCVWFTQKHAGDVMIVLYADAPVGDSHVGTEILFEKTRHHDERSKYCFGAWRLDGAVWLLVCTDKGLKGEHATRGIPSLTRLREEGEIDLCSLSTGCS